MLSESASIILSTASTIATPVVNASYTSIIFRNFDLKSALGEMWEKYDKFCLKPIQVSNAGTVTITLGSQSGTIAYNFKGLDWININYETNAGSQAWVPVFQLNLSGTSNTNNWQWANNGWSYNFRKAKRVVDLEIAISLTDYTSVGVTLPTANTYNNVQFHFVVEPVITGKMNECAFFGFNSNPNITTSVGRFVDAARKVYNYPSFDMRKMCSEFWGHHTDYEILMAWYQIRGVTTTSGDNRIMGVQMTGLNFTNNLLKCGNSTTNPSSNYSTTRAVIGTAILTTTTSNHLTETQYIPAPIQFEKVSDNVNLTIQFNNYDNTTVQPNTFSTPNFIFGFFIRPIYGMEKATLDINPWGLTTTETTLGVRDTNYTTFTLKNIDMRMVCRNIWHKYNKFNIFLTDTVATTAAGTTNNAAVILQMEGFDFINQTSWITTSAQTQTATLGAIFNTLVGEPKATGGQSSFCTTFYKTKDLVDLKLTALPLTPTTPFSVVQPLACNFTFTIVGVEE